MKVREVMHKGATWVKPSISVSKLARKMRQEDIGAVPVGENDRLIGMVTDRDICCRGAGNSRDISLLTARDVMSKPILYCEADQDVQTAVRAMRKAKVRRLPSSTKTGAWWACWGWAILPPRQAGRLQLPLSRRSLHIIVEWQRHRGSPNSPVARAKHSVMLGAV